MITGKPRPTRAPVLTLVPDYVSEDTVDCLQQLLHLARRGEVIGLAICAVLTQRRYFVDTAGVADDSPTFARGMIAALDDQLAAKIGSRA